MNITREQIIAAFKETGTDKLWRHGYDAMYFDIFKQMRPIKKLLEIGVHEGLSISSWLNLFPEAEIVGVDINLSKVNNETAMKARLVQHDAVSPLVRDVIPDTFDIIIDDGSHHPSDQWYSFLTFEDRWSQGYVIEDVIGTQHVKMLSKLLKRKGFSFSVYESNMNTALYRMNGTDQLVGFFAIVVHPKS